MAKYYAMVGEHEVGFEVVHGASGTTLRALAPESEDDEMRVDLAAVHARPQTGEGLYSLLVGGKSYQLYVEATDEGLRMAIWRHRFEVRVLTEREWRLQKVAPRKSAQSGEITIKSPMPGLVKSVMVSAGDEVKAGQRLVVLEAMKMENDINSPRDGRVASVFVQRGAVVEGGKPLVKLE